MWWSIPNEFDQRRLWNCDDDRPIFPVRCLSHRDTFQYCAATFVKQKRTQNGGILRILQIQHRITI